MPEQQEDLEYVNVLIKKMKFFSIIIYFRQTSMAAVLTSNGINVLQKKHSIKSKKETSKCEDTGTAGKVREEDIKVIAQHCCASVKRLVAESSHAEETAIAENSIKN